MFGETKIKKQYKFFKMKGNDIHMAINWTLADAVEKIQSGDSKAIQDIGGRFPQLAVCLAPGNYGGLIKLIKAMPDYFTARKAEAALKGEDSGEDENGSSSSKESATSGKGNGKAKAEEVDYDELSPKEVYELAKKRKIKFDEEKKKDKAYLIKLLKKADKAAAEAAKNKDDDDWDEEENSGSGKGKNGGSKKDNDDDEWDV